MHRIEFHGSFVLLPQIVWFSFSFFLLFKDSDSILYPLSWQSHTLISLPWYPLFSFSHLKPISIPCFPRRLPLLSLSSPVFSSSLTLTLPRSPLALRFHLVPSTFSLHSPCILKSLLPCALSVVVFLSDLPPCPSLSGRPRSVSI